MTAAEGDVDISQCRCRDGAACEESATGLDGLCTRCRHGHSSWEKSPPHVVIVESVAGVLRGMFL